MPGSGDDFAGDSVISQVILIVDQDVRLQGLRCRRFLAGNHPENAFAQFIARVNRWILRGSQGGQSLAVTQNGRAGELPEFMGVGKVIGMTMGNHDQTDLLRIDCAAGKKLAVGFRGGGSAGIDHNGTGFLHQDRIGVFFQNDAYGKAGLAGVTKALAARKLKPVAEATVERNSEDVAAAVAKLAPSGAQAIVQVGSYKACAA